MKISENAVNGLLPWVREIPVNGLLPWEFRKRLLALESVNGLVPWVRQQRKHVHALLAENP